MENKKENRDLVKLVKQVKRLAKDFDDTFFIKLLLDQWNALTPHFGGLAAHRYDGGSKHCAYCNRPKNWKGVNAGYLSMLVTDKDFLNEKEQDNGE